MRKIPLIRPFIPRLSELSPFLKQSHKAGLISNFGPNYWMATEVLYDRYGRHMVPCTTGTAAIELACRTTLPKSSRVMIPDFTHIGTYVGVEKSGMVPLICGVSKKTWAIDPIHLAMNVNKFDAFVVVAPFGYDVNIEIYEKFAALNNKKIIYDYAGAWGQFPETNFPVCYSLHATKTFSTGEGGIISFAHKYHAEEARVLSNFGITQTGEIWGNGGSNLKMDEIRLAMLCAHLSKPKRIFKRMQMRTDVLDSYKIHLGQLNFPDSVAPSMAVIPHMGFIDRFKSFSFVHKFYYPLLSSMRHLQNVTVLGRSDDYFSSCLALPIDVNSGEFERIVWEIKNEKKLAKEVGGSLHVPLVRQGS